MADARSPRDLPQGQAGARELHQLPHGRLFGDGRRAAAGDMAGTVPDGLHNGDGARGEQVRFDDAGSNPLEPAAEGTEAKLRAFSLVRPPAPDGAAAERRGSRPSPGSTAGWGGR